MNASTLLECKKLCKEITKFSMKEWQQDAKDKCKAEIKQIFV